MVYYNIQNMNYRGKKIDSLWPEFELEPRNMRLALSTNGVNPHADLSSRYSC